MTIITHCACVDNRGAKRKRRKPSWFGFVAYGLSIRKWHYTVFSSWPLMLYDNWLFFEKTIIKRTTRKDPFWVLNRYWLTWDHGPAIQFRWHAFLMQFWTPEGLSLGHKWLELSSVVPFLVWCIQVTERYCRPGPQVLEHGLHGVTSHLQEMHFSRMFSSPLMWFQKPFD